MWRNSILVKIHKNPRFLSESSEKSILVKIVEKSPFQSKLSYNLEFGKKEIFRNIFILVNSLKNHGKSQHSPHFRNKSVKISENIDFTEHLSKTTISILVKIYKNFDFVKICKNIPKNLNFSHNFRFESILSKTFDFNKKSIKVSIIFRI